MKRKLIVIGLFIFLISLAFLFFRSREREVTYFIPKLNMFVKLQKAESSDTVRVFLSEDNKGEFSGDEDCIQVLLPYSINFIVNQDQRETLIIPSFSRKYLEKIRKNKLTIKFSTNENVDTLFFKPQNMTAPKDVKKPYLYISISEYMEGVYIKAAGDSCFTKIEKYFTH